MAELNLWIGWIAILLGLVAGTAIGLAFHREDWLGGYNSWSRRMVRLAHISLIGTGLLNVGFALTTTQLQPSATPRLASVLMIIGAISMPSVCGLSAWRKGFRQLFFIPVLSLIVAVADLIVERLFS